MQCREAYCSGFTEETPHKSPVSEQAELSGGIGLGGEVASQIRRQLKEDPPWSKRNERLGINR